jgi:hypothetical protein
MFPTRAVLVALSVVALTAMQARAVEKEKEPDAIVEIGGSGNWSLSGPLSFGPTAAIEFTPIENWLEIEVGTGPMFGKRQSRTTRQAIKAMLDDEQPVPLRRAT